VENDMSSYKIAAAIAVVITVIGIVLVIIQYQHAATRTGTIIIPAGNTYLGPSNTSPPQPTVSDAAWHTVQGHIYPYTLSVPGTITLTTFPNDPYDMYAVSGNDPSSNVLIGLDNLEKNTSRNQYIKQQKTVYINQWWKQFGGLTGVKSIEPFTNRNGLKGYNVKFLNSAGQSPNLDVFFEIPDHPEYVIHLSNGTLDPAVFTKIVDSVGWETKK
jgi:hypothetical protein